VQNTAAREHLGAATSTINLTRTLGASLGVSLIGALFVHRLTSDLTADMPGAGARIGRGISSLTPQALSHMPPTVRSAIARAFAQALPPIFGYLIPLLALAFVLALLLPERPLRTTAHVQGTAGSS
jgi:hypothetical protein